MPKKQKPSAFMFFVQTYRANEEKRGKRLHIRQATEAAGAHWRNMTVAERAPYEKQAQTARFDDSSAEKYTSQGVPLSAVEKEQKEREHIQRQMKIEISEIVKTAFLNNQITEEPFYLIACNYFCKKETDYIPAELAISKYSVLEGNIKGLHTYLNPVKLPMGYSFEAREHSESTHRLPQPPKAYGERNWSKVIKDILEFMDCTALDVPILYTQKDDIEMVQSILQQMCNDANEDPKIFRVYPLSQLFFTLKEESCSYGLHEETGFKSIHIAEAILQKDHYDYRSGLACQYHEEADVGKYCTLSMVKRWGFVISEHISISAGVELIKGRHIPDDEEPAFSEMDETKSFVSQKSSVTINSSSAATDITEPIKHRRDVITPSLYSETVSSAHEYSSASSVKEYPPLSVRKIKAKNELKHEESAVESGTGKTAYNAWLRERQLPREPSEASLSFSNMSTARGRGILVDKKSTPSGSGLGRGKLFK